MRVQSPRPTRHTYVLPRYWRLPPSTVVRYPDWEHLVNPSIYTTPRQVVRRVYDPRTGRWVIQTERLDVRDSALDPYRHVIDPGSLRHVSRFEIDRYGRRVHVTGTTWTSYGVPHSNLNRRIVTHTAGGTIVDDEIVVRSRKARP